MHLYCTWTVLSEEARPKERVREREREREIFATAERELVGRVEEVRNRRKGAAMELDGEHELTHQLLACPSPQSMEVSLVEPFRTCCFPNSLLASLKTLESRSVIVAPEEGVVDAVVHICENSHHMGLYKDCVHAFIHPSPVLL